MSPRFRTVLIACVLVAVAAAVIRTMVAGADRPAGDFLRYERAATLVARGEGALLYDEKERIAAHVWGDRKNLPEQGFRYAPGLAVAMAPLGALPPETAWPIWSGICAGLTALGAGLAVALAVRRLPPGTCPWLPVVAAVVPLYALYSENVMLGQMNCFAFGLSMAALWSLDGKCDRSAGLLAAGATLAKHIPVLLILWFLWQRRWKAALWGASGVALLFYLLPTAVLGPSTHHALLSQWKAQEDHLVTEVGEAPGMKASNPSVVHVEGQSTKALLFRYLTPMPFFHLKDLKGGPEAGAGSKGILVNGGRDWGGATAFRLWLASMFVLLSLTVLATSPRPGEDPGAVALRFPLEAAMVLAAMVLVSPESRNPHFQVLAPALAGLAAGLAAETRRGGSWWGRAGMASLGALLVMIPTKFLLGRDGADRALAWGSIGGGGLLVFVALAWTLFRERERSPVPGPAEPAAAAP